MFLFSQPCPMAGCKDWDWSRPGLDCWRVPYGITSVHNRVILLWLTRPALRPLCARTTDWLHHSTGLPQLLLFAFTSLLIQQLRPSCVYTWMEESGFAFCGYETVLLNVAILFGPLLIFCVSFLLCSCSQVISWGPQLLFKSKFLVIDRNRENLLGNLELLHQKANTYIIFKISLFWGPDTGCCVVG